jgi:hypothetical protein
MKNIAVNLGGEVESRIIWHFLECSLALDKSHYLEFIQFQYIVKVS